MALLCVIGQQPVKGGDSEPLRYLLLDVRHKLNFYHIINIVDLEVQLCGVFRLWSLDPIRSDLFIFAYYV